MERHVYYFARKIKHSPGPAPRGAFRGHAPPNDCLCPLKRELCPEEINRLGAVGVQIEA